MQFDSNAVKMTTAEHDLTNFSEHAFSFSQFLTQYLNFSAPSSHFKNTQSHSTVQTVPINQRRTDAYFQLQGMFSSCNIRSVNVVLKENRE